MSYGQCLGSISLPRCGCCACGIAGFCLPHWEHPMWLSARQGDIYPILPCLGPAQAGCCTPIPVFSSPAVLLASASYCRRAVWSASAAGVSSVHVCSSRAADHSSCNAASSCLWPASCITTLAPSLPRSRQGTYDDPHCFIVALDIHAFHMAAASQ